MKRTWLVLIVLGMALIAPRWARAHDGHIHKIIGTVTARDVAMPETEAARVRLEMEAQFAAEWGLQR